MRIFLIICCLFTVGFCDSLTTITNERVIAKGEKREYLRELMRKKQDTTFTLDKSSESAVAEALNDSDAFVIKEALNVSGVYKIKANRTKVINCVHKADSISPMYASHIRQSAIKALHLLGGDSLNIIFRNLLQARSKYWFEGDLTMILWGVCEYGDSSSLDLVVSLKERIQRYKTEDPYYLQQRSGMLSTLATVENRLRER